MTTPEPAALARELAAKLTDEVNSDAVQEFLEAKGVDYDHTDVDEITLLVEQDPVYRTQPTAPADPIRHAALSIARSRLQKPIASWELVRTWAEAGDTPAVEAELARIADTLTEVQP